jgi:quercetin dioxygenase-like cupin family protein
MGSEIRFVYEGELTKNAWSLTECVAPRDVGPPPHRHAWDEAYYVLEGQVRFTIDDHELVLGAGEFVHISGGTAHGFKGASDAVARMLILDVPANAAGFFVDAEREVREMPRDLAKVPGIGMRHGIEFLPPG